MEKSVYRNYSGLVEGMDTSCFMLMGFVWLCLLREIKLLPMADLLYSNWLILLYCFCSC